MRILVISDPHFPFQDNKALKLVDKFIINEKPDIIVINGDLLDCYDVSSFPKDPRRKKRLVDEIKMGKKYLEHLNDISDAKKILVEGNHENRVDKHMINKNPEMIEFINLKELLKTKGWRIIDDSIIENYVKIGKWYIGHFNKVAKHSAMTAKGIVNDRGVNIIQGHTHRLGAYYVRHLDRSLRGLECGCLCTLKPSYTSNPNWQQGFVLIEDKNAYPIEIINHSFTWNGKVYK